jgi:hypothetical protein
MRHQYHHCAHLRVVRLDASDLSHARKGGSVVLEELCEAKQLAPCVGLLECDVLPLGPKQELLLASARRLRSETGESALSGVSELRRRELEALRSELIGERKRIALGWMERLGKVRSETELARQLGPTWRVEAIDRALDAMEAGPYGFCAACGGSIEMERLRLVPDTQVCVGCAGRAAPPR